MFENENFTDRLLSGTRKHFLMLISCLINPFKQLFFAHWNYSFKVLEYPVYFGEFPAKSGMIRNAKI